MGDLRRAATYPFRRAWFVLLSPNPPCQRQWCARPQYSLTLYCYQHVVEILGRRP